MIRKSPIFPWFGVILATLVGSHSVLGITQTEADIHWMVPGIASPISAWAMEPDTGQWAVATEDGSVKWGYLHQDLFSTWYTATGFVTALAWADGGELLMAGDNRGRLHHIHAKTALSTKSWILDEVSLLAILVRVDGSLVVGTAAPTSYWIPVDGEPVAFGHHEGGVMAIREEGDAGVIQLIPREGTVSHWKQSNGFLVLHEDEPSDPSEDETAIREARTNGLPSLDILEKLTERKWVQGRSLDWSRDFTGQNRILLTSAPSWLTVDPYSGRFSHWDFPDEGHAGGVAGIVHATLLADGCESLWIKDGFEEVKPAGFRIPGGITHITSAANRRVFALAGGPEGQIVSAQRLESGFWESLVIPELPEAMRGTVTSMGLSSDGRFLLVATLKSPASLGWCDLSTQDPRWNLIPLPGVVRKITPHPWKSYFALVFSDRHYEGFGELEFPEGFLRYAEERRNPLSISYSPVDGHLLIGAGESLEVRQGKDVLGQMGGEARHVTATTYSPDGRVMILGRSDGSLVAMETPFFLSSIPQWIPR